MNNTFLTWTIDVLKDDKVKCRVSVIAKNIDEAFSKTIELMAGEPTHNRLAIFAVNEQPNTREDLKELMKEIIYEMREEDDLELRRAREEI